MDMEETTRKESEKEWFKETAGQCAVIQVQEHKTNTTLKKEAITRVYCPPVYSSLSA